jgi:hypothetical protein
MSNTNPGYAFPLEKLGSDIARNQFNYESILNGLVAWDNTTEDEVTIRLTMGVDPYYWDYRIPSKKSVTNSSSFECSIEGVIKKDDFAVECRIINSLYGGSRDITESSFDANADVNVGTNQITFDDITGWTDGGDPSQLQLQKSNPSDVLPTPLQEGVIYKILDITGNDVTLQDINDVPIVITAVGSGIIKAVEKEFNPISSTSDPGDVATIRMSVDSSGGCDWNVNYIELTNEWMEGSDYRWGNLVTYDDGGGTRLYRAIFDIDNAQVSDTPDTSINWESWVTDWVSGTNYPESTKVSYLGDIYTVTSPITEASLNPKDNTSFELYAEAWVSGESYTEGSYVVYDYMPYIAKYEVLGSPDAPDVNDNWFLAVTELVPSSSSFNASAIFQWQLTYDVSGFIIRNIGPLDNSEVDTKIGFRLSARNLEPASIYQRSVETFSTSNFSYWPTDLNKVWEEGTTYGPADTGIAVNNRQDYSSVMVFDHTRQDIAKTVNFINYDGPDLDKGLCIYLPVEINVGDGGVARPEDGFTYEFFFRIWPTAQLTGSTTRDHIINKAQIYVYNALNGESVPEDSCSSPVAKFSMARSTNFYMFGENVSIPDKPVHYRATFIYSATEKRWNTLDYYQLPDHLFVGPVGFIDPQNPSNLDINNDALGNTNPDAQFIGYETAGFPLFQDPFSNSDLTPYQFTSEEELDAYKNRIS